ncbi:hypothetical protein QE152_g1127 [Popillia japonica]|uniref:Uncharacterized protein n=1 Tax=Popillia japonica TaxID=7064 RepID=A0AAW1N9E4_POPJA
MGNKQEKESIIMTIEENFGSLNGIKKSKISLIPLEVLQTKVTAASLHEAWYAIPKNKRMHLREYLPCFRHYNKPFHEDHIDGPLPARRNCPMCKHDELVY